MAKQNQSRTVDCACVIHGQGYDWRYVDTLYHMLKRHLPDVRLHVYTEHARSVPEPYIKHSLIEWPGIAGPKKAWWYKVQLFNKQEFSGDLLYLDLDTVITGNLEWITQLDTRYLWAIRDFKYLQTPHKTILNSSVMWFNVNQCSHVWDTFQTQDVSLTTRRYPGDQDYIQATLGVNRYRLFPENCFQSWRWQCVDGGYNFASRTHNTPGTGTAIAPGTSVVVFHGNPKPHTIKDPVIQELWR